MRFSLKIRASALVVLLPYLVRHASASPPVNVGLKASWNSAPFLLELLETAAEENKTSYFPLLDQIASGSFARETSDEALYHEFLRVANTEGFLSSSEELASFNLALSIRAAAPRIEAHYQYYDTALEPKMGQLYDPSCKVWLQWNTKQYCDTKGGFKNMLRETQRFPNERRTLPFDRVLGDGDEKPAAILYGDIANVQATEFREFHTILKDYATQGLLSYRVRYRSPLEREERPLVLSGYGVELALKKTDYMVMDDRGVEEAEAKGEDGVVKPDGDKDQVPLGELSDEEAQDIKPLHEKDIASLGLKAASFVMKSEDPFNTLQRLSQDFPKHSAAIAAGEIDPSVQEELADNWDMFIGNGKNALFINGLQLDSSQINTFALIEHLRRERGYVNRLRALGLNSSEAVQLLSHKILAEAREDEQIQRYDYRDDAEGGEVIAWLNDLEKDKRYKDWSPAVNTILRRVYPGQLHQLRKNLNNLVLPLDFSSAEDLSLVIENLVPFIQKKLSLRFGLVPLTKSKNAEDQAKVFYHLMDTYGLKAAVKYIELSLLKKEYSKPSQQNFINAIEEASLRRDRTAKTFSEILNDEKLDERMVAAKKWCERLAANSPTPPLFINGQPLLRDEDWMQRMSQQLSMDVALAQRAVYEQKVDDDTNLADFMLRGAVKRRNSHIVPEGQDEVKIVNLAEIFDTHSEVFRELPTIIPDTSDNIIDSSIWVIGDFDEEDGYELMAEAVELLKSSSSISLILLNNPQVTETKPTLSTLLYQLQQVKLLNTETIGKLLKEVKPTKEYVDLPHVENFGAGTMQGAKAESWQFPDHLEAGKFWNKGRKLVTALGFQPGERGIVVNGRIVGPIPKRDSFVSDDFQQLVEYERSKRANPVLDAAKELDILKKINGGSFSIASLINVVSLTANPQFPTGIYDSAVNFRTDIPHKKLKGEHTAIVSGDKDGAAIQILVSLDPASDVAQKWISLLRVLSEMQGVYLQIFLNPAKFITELPIKRFYRHVLNAKPVFDENGYIKGPRAVFENIPEGPLLSLSMDVPPSWLVTPKECIYDLDNLKLDSLKDRLRGADVEAMYELRYILIEGHSRDTSSGGAPRGAQLVLGTDRDPHFADTIVMANLGYFQFKANPGYWKMALQEGRSKEIFNIDDVGLNNANSQSLEKEDTPEIALLSFQGTTLFPRLSRKPGMETEDVLEPSNGNGNGPVGVAKKWFKKAEGFLTENGILKDSRGKGKAEINIFSVASGHLYERFLNIMMLSVMKNTDKTVKFWFIENFLSPSFKDFIPLMAEEYGFEYELVTYKWPHWLRAQKEKQREIWGYKILFLDVLFPLDLDKVIFVDADQIVRTDLKELVDLDLHGAPYGFTPMCDSREEIEGFRFWKQGYWKTFLRGLPYHISALYVVDLKRFRQIAAGDRLRQTYHQLSADPQSLSNLDQDLPNHMQSVLPIFSLPQEWLWCETWCSDESLKTAKTIDLCNNPMTKEPKLDRARRQVPEWTVYDDEVARLAKRSLVKEGDTVGHLTDVLKESAEPVVETVVKETPDTKEKKIKDEL